jgi:hypothetical protein
MASGLKTIKQTENKKQDRIMKTKNRNTGTRKSKFKNAFLKGGAIVISFILISFTVSAQGFWRQLLTESSLSNVAMIMVGDTGKKAQPETNDSSSYSSIGDESFYNTFKAESDKLLNLEAWMIDNNYFASSSVNVAKATDPGLELENWMINNKYFSTVPNIQSEKDSELELENWMLSDNFWRM